MSPPFLTTQIVSGDVVAVGSPAQIPCLILPSPIATTGAVFAFNPGADPRSVLGLGLACDLLLYALRDTAGVVNVAVAAGTWSAAPSITHLDASGSNSPTGPTVTVALGAGVPGCLDDHQLVLRVTTAGALGTAQASLAYDGGAGVETFTIPTESAAVLRGTVDLTPDVLAQASGTHFDFTAPTSATLTFPAGSLGASAAGLKAATATSASPVTLHASDLIAAGVTVTHANVRRLRFTTAGGTAADAPANVAITGLDYAGASQTETLSLAQTAASVTSVKAYDLTTCTLAYAAADGTGATIAIGYEDTYASPAELAAELSALAAAALFSALARVAQGTGSQLGKNYLEIYTASAGAGVSLTIDAAASTAEALFGFTSGASNLTTTGAASTYSIPASGLVLTFPAGTYPIGESYLAPCIGPRCSIAAIAAAATAAMAAFATTPFGFFDYPLPAADAPTCKATVDALETIRAAALVANVPRDVYACVGGPWHTASATAATNATNITSNDQATLSAFQSAAANPNSVAADDCYITGSTLLAAGSFRRSTAIAWAVKRAAAARVAATVTEGTVPEASLLAPDGLTTARDQNTATVHLEGLDGPGFFCLKSADDTGAVKFCLGATRAGATSRLRHDGDFAVCAEAARLVQAVVKPWEGQRPGVDPLSGQMVGHDKGSRAGQVDAAIRSFLLPDNGLANCSDFGVLIGDPPTGKFVDNGIAPVTVTVDTLGTIQRVQIQISATGTTTIVAPAGA